MKQSFQPKYKNEYYFEFKINERKEESIQFDREVMKKCSITNLVHETNDDHLDIFQFISKKKQILSKSFWYVPCSWKRIVFQKVRIAEFLEYAVVKRMCYLLVLVENDSGFFQIISHMSQ